jgi:hypothetical protein
MLKRKTVYHSKRINDIRYPHLAEICLHIASYCDEVKRFKSVLDLGSSCGPLLREMSNLKKFKKIVGVDCSKDAEQLWVADEAEFFRKDMNEVFDLNYKFDLITCLEVAEHIEKTQSVIDNINNHAHDETVLILSAAPPDQPSRGHVNCRPYTDWMYDFMNCGWFYSHKATATFAYLIGKKNQSENKRAIPLYYLNSMIFVKRLSYMESPEEQIKNNKNSDVINKLESVEKEIRDIKEIVEAKNVQ